VTPVIIARTKDEEGRQNFWSIDRYILKLQKQLQDNLEKKYQAIFNEKLESTQNFIQLLEIKN